MVPGGSLDGPLGGFWVGFRMTTLIKCTRYYGAGFGDVLGGLWDGFGMVLNRFWGCFAMVLKRFWDGFWNGFGDVLRTF